MFHFFMVIDVDFKDQIKMLLPSCYFPDVFIFIFRNKALGLFKDGEIEAESLNVCQNEEHISP